MPGHHGVNLPQAFEVSLCMKTVQLLNSILIVDNTSLHGFIIHALHVFPSQIVCRQHSNSKRVSLLGVILHDLYCKILGKVLCVESFGVSPVDVGDSLTICMGTGVPLGLGVTPRQAGVPGMGDWYISKGTPP
eukprot:scaffold1600_cov179-Amphora_coffeaeformis.AAC.21